MIKPFLLYGGSSKERKDWAQEISDRNGWRIFEVDRKTFERKIYKSSATTTLSNTPNIIYLPDADKMSAKDLEKLFKLISGSPHRLVMAAGAINSMPATYKNKCNVIRIGYAKSDNFFLVLNSIMNEPDREKVRQLLVDHQDKVHVFYHILKNNVWKCKNPQALKAIDFGMRMFYKVKNDYLISILAYSFPVCKIPLTYDKKRKIYKEEADILIKMRKKMRLSEIEAVETYECVREIIKHPPPNFALRLVKDLGLVKKEIEFLGLEVPMAVGKKVATSRSKQVASSFSHPTVKPSNLNKWM